MQNPGNQARCQEGAQITEADPRGLQGLGLQTTAPPASSLDLTSERTPRASLFPKNTSQLA